MKRVLIFSLVAAVGCGGSAPRSVPDSPLSVAEWKQLPADRKYQPEALERLRAGEPKFAADDAAWDAFMRATVLPGRKKELPKK